MIVVAVLATGIFCISRLEKKSKLNVPKEDVISTLKMNENEKSENISWTKDKVKVEVVQDSISNLKGAVKITDKNEIPASYSKAFELEIYDGEKWIDMIEKGNVINPMEMTFLPNQNGELELSYDFENLYGRKISEGTYRIVIKAQNGNTYETLYSDNFEIK